VVSAHVQLKRSGKTYKALCPFHQEKTPSFTVNPDRQIYKCFGCGEGGNVFRFLMEFEKLSFPEAVELLANGAGIPLPRRSWGPAEEQSLYPVLSWAASHFQRELAGRTGGAAREYLERRGLGKDTVERFGLGWAPAGWENLSRAAQGKYSPALLLRAGLVVQNDRGGHYDRFRERVVIPIRSALGRTVGFGARTLGDEEPKYINSPETEVFSKSRVLFGLSEAKEAFRAEGEALVVEGYLDAMALAQASFGHVVASCGTAFTEDQARILGRYVRRAVLIFDGDTAGLRAAWKSAAVFLGAGLDVRIVALPEGHDPDSFVRDEGASALAALCEQAPGVVGFARETLLDRLERREDLLKTLAYLGSRIEDPIRRRVLLQEAADQFRFSEELLAREAAKGRKEARRSSPRRPEERSEPRDVLGRLYLAGVLTGEIDPEGDSFPEIVFHEQGLRALHGRCLELRSEGETQIQNRLLDDETFRGLVTEILAAEQNEGTYTDAVMRLRDRMRTVKGQEIRLAIEKAEAHGDRDLADRLLRDLHSLKETGS
jgi:DNA primase